MFWARSDQKFDDSQRTVRSFLARYLLSEDFTLGIFSPDERMLWGATGFHLREGPLRERSAEIGMWIRTERARGGLGTRVLEAVLHWGFTEWPWLRLSWHCDSKNKPSGRVATKAGMRLEGTLRSHRIDTAGARRDTLCFAALRDEWLRDHAPT